MGLPERVRPSGRVAPGGVRWLSTGVLLVALGAVVLLAKATAYGQEPITFLEVALDEDTRRADQKLRRLLTNEAGLTFVSERPLEYAAVIDRLVKWNPDRGPFLARVTPYVFVAAEILGADMEVVATYLSRATGSTTYHSYFVVNRERFPYTPELGNVVDYLQAQREAAVFGYHSTFSTSSYFLPSLYFRDNGIFNMAESTEDHVAIHARQVGKSSSDLVKGVASGEFDFAAVYDGTKTRFENVDSLFQRYGSQVYFIKLLTAIPNDLLVASASMDSATSVRIREVVGSMRNNEIDVGDFLTWRDFNSALVARESLANLRWLARERPAPVTVDVTVSADGGNSVPGEYLEAARQAVRLSGTEFVNYDHDFHAHQDYVWTLIPIHDGAIQLRSRIIGSDIEDQEFQISFKDTEDLTRRICSLIQSRIHRIRYVWPYVTEPPTVIRDVGFSIPENAIVKVRLISWRDPQRNLFQQDTEFDARVEHADFHKFELGPSFIQSDEGAFGFNPMSNISYRVILVRPAQESAVFRLLTVVFVLLLVGGAAAALLELRRAQSVAGVSVRR